MTSTPTPRRTRRLTALAGLTTIAVFLAEIITWGNPQYTDPASRLRELFGVHHVQASVSLTLAAFSIIPLLVFTAGLTTLTRRDGADGIWSTVLTAASAVFAAAQIIFAALSGALVAAAPTATGHELMLLLGPLTYLDGARFMPFAVMTGAAALLVLRAAPFRRWIGLIGLASAAGNLIGQLSLLDFTGTSPISNLGAASQLGFLLFIVWTIAIAVTLLKTKEASPAAAPNPEAVPAGSR
jgi:hypothetical protein